MDGNDGFWLRLVTRREERAADQREGEGIVPGAPTIFVVDDDLEMRELLVRLLEPLDMPVATFGSAESFLAAHRPQHAGCLVLDVRLPGMDGFALFNTLKGMGAQLPVIFLTGYAEVSMARYALLAGASDFLEKPVARPALLAAVRIACERSLERRRAFASYERMAGLTAREWDVLRLVVAGKANKVISADLGISQKTVEAHRARVMAKTGANSVADLVRMFSAYESSGMAVGHEREVRFHEARV
jgi:FixJ family two-component response regulator